MKKTFLNWTDELVLEFTKQVILTLSSSSYAKKTLRDRLNLFKEYNGVPLKQVEFSDKTNTRLFMKKYAEFVEKNSKDLTIRDITLLNDFSVFLEQNNLLKNEQEKTIRPGFGASQDGVRL